MLNKVQLIGNLGADPETRFFPQGGQVTSLSLATTRKWKDKNGEKQEETEWHRVQFFGKLSEIADKYLKKGSKVYVEGRIKTRKWQDKDGADRYSTEIIGESMQMLDSKPAGSIPTGAPESNKHQEDKRNGYQADPNDFDYDPDELPF